MTFSASATSWEQKKSWEFVSAIVFRSPLMVSTGQRAHGLDTVKTTWDVSTGLDPPLKVNHLEWFKWKLPLNTARLKS